MPALIKENETFEIKIYRYIEDGKDTFEPVTPKARVGEELTFVFKRPAWGETRRIMSQSVRFVDGKGEVDPYCLMDSRLKILLKSWSLKNDDGKPIPVTEENVERLPSALVETLHGLLSGNLE